MIEIQDKQKVLNILNSTLGSPDNGKPNEYIYYCPFCHHHKKKLNINTENQKWHCWVCDAKGKRIFSLLKRLDVDARDLNIIRGIYKNEGVSEGASEGVTDFKLFLPKEFISLNTEPTRHDIQLKHAIAYVEKRGITKSDISKYNIGFCSSGLYRGRIIIPSYKSNGELNYFIARTIWDNTKPYENPPVSKNIIAFENQINWNEPITLVEGAFDAIAVKRNVIPIFGKFIPKKLMEAILKHKVKEIIIMLDADAQKQAMKYVEYFQKQGIKVTNIVPSNKDASKMGFTKANELIKNTSETTFENLIYQKIKNL